MSNLHQQLQEIRRRQGREPLPDPTRIEGFGGDNDPPAPPIQTPADGVVIRTAAELFGPALTDEPPSVDQVMKQGGMLEPQVPDLADKAELVVADKLAAYKGRHVELNDSEQKAIAQVVLRAIRRSLDEQFHQLTGKKPRTRRKKSAS